MRIIVKIIAAEACVAALLLAVVTYGLVRGYFDHGLFQIKQAKWSGPNQVAMVAERSDHEALGGLEYFVIIGNHVFSPDELRHAYYSDARVFSTGNGPLDLHWSGQSKLVVAGKGAPIAPTDINVQKWQSGGIAISYENIIQRSPAPQVSP